MAESLLTADTEEVSTATWDQAIRVANAAHHRRDWVAAEAHWEVIRSRFPDRWDGFGRGAEAMRELGRLNEAQALLDAVPDQFREHPLRLHDLARLAERRNDWATAETLWRRFIVFEPERSWAYTSLANTLHQQGMFLDAESFLADAIRRMPDDPEILIHYARLAEQRHEWELALSRWETVRQRFPLNIVGYTEGAQSLLRARRTEEAKHVIALAAVRFPNDTHVLSTVARFAARRGSWQEAVTTWEVVRSQPNPPPAAYIEGARALFNIGRYPEAEALIDVARERIPTDMDVARAKVDLAVWQRNWREAARRWGEVRQQFPRYSLAYTEEARLLNDADDPVSALDLLNKAHDAFPNNEHIAFAWIRQSAKMLPPSEVRSRWEDVRCRFGEQPECALAGADVLRQIGGVRDADTVLLKAIDQFPANADIAKAWADLGTTLEDLHEGANRYTTLLPRFTGNRDFVVRALRALALADRTDGFLDATTAALRLWPADHEITQIGIDHQLRRGDADGTFLAWAGIANSPDISVNTKTHYASQIFKAYPIDARSVPVLRFLLSEPDDETFAWRPAISTCFTPEIDANKLKIIASWLDGFDSASLSPICLLVARTAVGGPILDSDFKFALITALKDGRVRLLMSLFRSSYYAAKNNPERRAGLMGALLKYWSGRLMGYAFDLEKTYNEILACLYLAFTYDADTFKLMIIQLEDAMGEAAASLPSIIARRRDVVANIIGRSTVEQMPPTRKITCTSSPLKVALCVSGQLRGFRSVVPTWKHLGLEAHETHCFIHSWREVGFNWRRALAIDNGEPLFKKTIFSPSGREILKTRYPALNAALDELEVGTRYIDPDEVMDLFRTKHLVVEDDSVPPYRGHSNMWKMYYKIEQSFDLMQASGIDFDLVIRLRPDLPVMPSEGLDWRDVQERSCKGRIVYTESPPEFYAQGDEPIVGDKFYAGALEPMAVACRAFSFAKRITDERMDLDMPSGYHGHTTLAYTAFYNGVSLQRVPNLQIGPLVNASPLAPDIALRALRADISSREMDDLDKAMLAAIELDLSRKALP